MIRNYLLSIAVILQITLAALVVTAQTTDIKRALEDGVCAFENKDYRLAQNAFERGLQQDPTNKLLMLFAARAIDFQVDPKNGTAANIGKARSAIDAYSKLHVDGADDGEAVSAVVR